MQAVAQLDTSYKPTALCFHSKGWHDLLMQSGVTCNQYLPPWSSMALATIGKSLSAQSCAIQYGVSFTASRAFNCQHTTLYTYVVRVFELYFEIVKSRPVFYHSRWVHLDEFRTQAEPRKIGAAVKCRWHDIAPLGNSYQTFSRHINLTKQKTQQVPVNRFSKPLFMWWQHSVKVLLHACWLLLSLLQMSILIHVCSKRSSCELSDCLPKIGFRWAATENIKIKLQ